MSNRCFVDTNILIYAHDREAGTKHEKAARFLEDLWDQQSGVLSIQVLQEFYVNVTRKIPKPLSRAQARNVIEAYAAWLLAVNGAATLVRLRISRNGTAFRSGTVSSSRPPWNWVPNGCFQRTRSMGARSRA